MLWSAILWVAMSLSSMKFQQWRRTESKLGRGVHVRNLSILVNCTFSLCSFLYDFISPCMQRAMAIFALHKCCSLVSVASNGDSVYWSPGTLPPLCGPGPAELSLFALYAVYIKPCCWYTISPSESLEKGAGHHTFEHWPNWTWCPRTNHAALWCNPNPTYIN